MRITHLTSVHTRYDTRIFYKHAVFAAKSGFDTTLLVNDKLGNEVQNNVKIFSTNWSFESKFMRVIYSIFFFPFKAKAIDSDVYVFHDPELMICGGFLKLINKKVIYDIHEDYELIHFENRGLVRRFIGRFYKMISFYLIRKFDGVFVVNQRLQYKYNSIAKRLLVIPNYPILGILNHKSEASNYSKIRIIFAGGITEDWNIGPIASLLGDIEDVEFHIAGKFNAYLDSILVKNHPNLIYHGQLKHEDTIELMGRMDVGIAFSNSIQLQGEGSIGNTKVFEYLASGLTVIVNKNKTWLKIIEGNEVGFVIEQVEEIIDIVNQLKKDNTRLLVNKNNSRRLVIANYNWDSTFKHILDIYKEFEIKLQSTF